MSALSTVPYLKLTEALQALGRELLAWRGDADLRRLHSRSEFKTEADRRADHFLKDALAGLFPGVPVCSEEDEEQLVARPARYWLIDPIDGTASWYEGFAGFVTQCALIEEGEPRIGIIHSPAVQKTWMAAAGAGAFLNGQAMPRCVAQARCIVVDNTPAPHGNLAEVMGRVGATGYLESGSLGLKAVLVADGTADLFIKRVKVRDWDLAAASVVLSESGACLALPDGSPFRFDGEMTKPGVIVARDADLMRRGVAALGQTGSRD